MQIKAATTESENDKGKWKGDGGRDECVYPVLYLMFLMLCLLRVNPLTTRKPALSPFYTQLVQGKNVALL